MGDIRTTVQNGPSTTTAQGSTPRRSACQGIILRVLCLKQGIQFDIFVSNRAIPANVLLFYCNVWFSLEQGKKRQPFLLDRIAKFTSFAALTGSGFR